MQQSIEDDKSREELDTIKDAMSLLIAKLDPETMDKILKFVKNP